jgi:biotin synthase
MTDIVRHDWTRAEIRALHDLPILDLVFRAATVYRTHHDAREMQVCKLISIKTGACPEDCAYCAQSSRYKTDITPQTLLKKEAVMEIAQRAKENGASRVCMGAAWREVKDGPQFDRVIDMVRDVTGMGIEVCCTLGMLNESQARRLEDAGLYAYNHNVDSSAEFYKTIITTRTYADRLQTIGNVRKTNVTVCCGGIMTTALYCACVTSNLLIEKPRLIVTLLLPLVNVPGRIQTIYPGIPSSAVTRKRMFAEYLPPQSTQASQTMCLPEPG